MPSLQMMPGGMNPTGWYGGSMWLTLIVPTVIVGILVIIILAFFFRREPYGGPASAIPESPVPVAGGTGTVRSERPSNPPNNAVLAGVIRSLAPTLTDDERRVMDELVKAGGEALQSDLPRLTDFSKATVSKAIHGLEVRAIVVRERHKWTYWCKVNPDWWNGPREKRLVCRKAGQSTIRKNSFKDLTKIRIRQI